MLADKHGLEHLDDLLLLTTRQAGNAFDKTTEPPAWCGSAAGARLAQEFFDRDTERLGDVDEDIRTGEVPTGLPKVDIGRLLVDLACQFTKGKARLLAKVAESGCSFGHAAIVKAR